jgi:hypothetical protein
MKGQKNIPDDLSEEGYLPAEIKPNSRLLW